MRPLLAVAPLLLAACSSTPPASSADGPAVTPNPIAELWGGPAGKVSVGGTYWTRTHVRIVNGNIVDCDSWLSGEFLQMGTEVTVLETAKSDTRWHVKTREGRDFWICVGHGGAYGPPHQEIQKFLAAQDPRGASDMGSGEVAAAIAAGRPVVGMTRAQVVGTLGFPPNIGDPAASQLWKYPQLNRGYRGSRWGGRLDRHNVGIAFQDGIVSHVEAFDPD